MADHNIEYHLLESFDETRISAAAWNDLVGKGISDVLFMTWHWQKAWWEAFRRGKLLIVLAEEHGIPVAIAPLFAEYGMIYFVGSGGSDYLDFIGSIDRVEILEGMLSFAAQQVPDFQGCQFYHVPEASPTASFLSIIAERRRWKIYDEGEWNCPELELKKYPEQAQAAPNKKSLLRHEGYFKRNGVLETEHLRTAEAINPFLDEFFRQHISRWEPTRFPSLFLDDQQKLFFSRFTEIASDTGWLRFTRIIWNGNNVAFHFGFNYKGVFFWYKPTFDIALAKHSPGEVLLRQLLLEALQEQAHTFDFGLGEEAFKSRFATGTKRIKTWGLYKTVSKKVLVISPHPDDESIGCGGTIRKHIVDGDSVEIIFLTSGEHGGLGKTLAEQTVRVREEEAKQAASILEISAISFWREPDGRIAVNETNLRKLADKIVEMRPSVIYVTHEQEEHADHRAAAQLVRQALGLLPPSPDLRPIVLMYEVWTPIQHFTHIVDISPYVEVKRHAIRTYVSQCSLVKFDEAILGLNRYRGEMHSWPGGDYAEIFAIMENQSK